MMLFVFLFRFQTVSRHSLVCSLGVMVPVRARRQIKYPVGELGVNAPSERVLAEREAYALNHINRKLTLEPKVRICCIALMNCYCVCVFLSLFFSISKISLQGIH